MASSRIKGITIEIGGDTTGLKKALSDVDKSIRDTQSELKDVDRLLKIDPTNIELLTQKQRLLTSAIGDTQDRLKTLREAEKQAQEQFKKGEISKDAYDALKREIINTEQSEKNLKTALDDTNTALKNQGDKMDTGVLKAGLMKDALEKIAQKLIEVGKQAINYNAQMESFTATFTSFLGSATDAEKAISDIMSDAASMPFGSSDLIEANKALITTGESAENSRENINALASAVAATGGGNAELSRMASNLAQIKNVGKATSMDIKQFANAGINIYGLLSDYTGKSIDEVKDLDVTYDDLTAALKMATEEGGRYYGAMEAQAETYNGQLNTLKARAQEALGTTFKSLSDTLKNDIFPAINQALDSIDFEKLGESIGKIVSLVSDVLPVVMFVVGETIDLIGNIIDNINPIIDSVKNVLNEIVNFITNVFSGNWKAAWQSIVNLVGELFAGICNTVVGVVNTIIDALNKVISWFTGNSNTIGKLGSISFGGKPSTSSGPKVLPGGQRMMASGGTLSNGSAIVGEHGAELLTMNGGVATLTPITNNSVTNLGGINLSVYGAQGQNVNELADVVMERIQTAVNQRGAVWA